MKFGFKNLNHKTNYTIVNIDRIRRNDNKRAYDLRIVLAYEKNGKRLLQERYSNVQFGRLLRCGLTFIGDRFCQNDDLIEVNLPSNTFSGFTRCHNSDEYLQEGYLTYGDFEYKEDVDPGYIRQRILVASLRPGSEVNGQEVKFVTVPTFELIRFFLFGVNKYNEILLEGTMFDAKVSNKMYDPDDSYQKIADEGRKIRYVKLRKEIPDSCVQLVGDLIYEKRVREMANKLVSLVMADRNPFYIVRFPIFNVRSIRCYGKFVKNVVGEVGFEVSSFANIEYGDKYSFERENDGRTTSTRTDDMKKAFFGKRKRKPKKKPKKKIDHDQQGDHDHESVSITDILDEYTFEDRDTDGIKLEKIDQEYIAGKKYGEIGSDPKGVAPVSNNGGYESGYSPVDNDDDLNKDSISEKKYWTQFPVIIEHLKDELGVLSASIDYLTNTGRFDSEPSICRFSQILESKDPSEFYFVRVSYSLCKFYIVELNPEEFKLPTLIFWDEGGCDLSEESFVKKLLYSYLKKGGNALDIIKDLDESNNLYYSKLTHQCHIRKSNLSKRYIAKEALKHQGIKLAKKIMLQIMG